MTALRVVVSGAGAAGVACANLLQAKGISDITVLDSQGILHRDRTGMNRVKAELAARTNPFDRTGGMVEALEGADVFVGVSGGVVPEELIATMAPNSIVFALSNPDPEVHPDAAAKHAAIVATGRSDFPNQINNVLAFPGVFRGALDAGARRITEEMKIAAAEAIYLRSPSTTWRRIGSFRARSIRGSSRRSRLPWRPLPNRGVTAGRFTALALTAALATAGCGHRTHHPAELVVGSRAGIESTLLADVYTGALRSYGFPARTEQAPDPLSKLDSGAFVVVPSLTGRVLQVFQPGAVARSDAQVYKAMIGALPEGIAAGDYTTAAEDKPALAVAGSTSKDWGGSELGVLTRHCDGLTVDRSPAP